MRVLFTCGGTGGHINPALAVAKMLAARQPEAQIRFAGAKHGMEAKLVPAEGFPLDLVDVEGFSHKLSFSGISQNVRAARKTCRSLRWARQVLDAFSPDVVVGTGGYACFPILYTASKRHIPTIIHESNAYPGLVTRTLARRMDRVLVNFAKTAEYLGNRSNITVSGMPIREDLIYKERAEARRELGLDDRPLIVSFWGSLGAREMNRAIARFIAMETREDRFSHIHATGRFGYAWMPEYIASLGVDLAAHPNIDLREYIHDMPRVMAAADLVICRGGASTLSELAALGKPAIIVPSPNVSANHQEKNAGVFAAAGGAVLLREQDATPERLFQTASELLSQPERLADMSRALHGIAVLDGCERIYREIMALARKR